MAIENIEALLPDASKYPVLDIIGKYRNDLWFLEEAEKHTTEILKNNGIANEEIDKKLEKLRASIDQLRQAIIDFDKKIAASAVDSNEKMTNSDETSKESDSDSSE